MAASTARSAEEKSGAERPSATALLRIASAKRGRVRWCQPPATNRAHGLVGPGTQLVVNVGDDVVERTRFPDEAGQDLVGTGFGEAKIAASTRPIHSRQRSSGGRSASTRSNG